MKKPWILPCEKAQILDPFIRFLRYADKIDSRIFIFLIIVT